MPKTVEAGDITVGGHTFNLRVQPDVFDGRDLAYRPRLQLLPPEVWPRPGGAVMQQAGNSCTGHALAAVINTALGPGTRASPYMLYALARRYDEFPGTADAGSSLRGALKGWFHHGVVDARRWRGLRTPLPDLEDEAFRAECAQMPLGAFYRVNPYRIDDMQSAISELNAVAASGVIHGGWTTPATLQKGARTLRVIDRRIDAPALGGHAFALVGYNEVGFVVQNSWGRGWGDGGFAVLPYEDWLESAYDAWVARPGVRAAKLYVSGWEGGQRGTAGELLSAPGPEIARLTRYVVNLGAGGRLSGSGRFTSSPAQLDQIITHMTEFHAAQQEAHVVLYAHGGLVSEREGLIIAQKHLNWWLNNGVYPITLAWQSGAGETLESQLAGLLGPRLPAGGLGFDLVEQFDRLVEGAAGHLLKWLWDEMKRNAHAAGEPLRRGSAANAPGGTLLLRLLAGAAGGPAYHGKPLRLHLLGHSAGTLLLGGLLRHLKPLNLRAETLQFLAPAMTLAEFARVVLPHLQGDQTARRVGRMAVFSLTEQDELDDTVGAAGVTPYHKSLLYLVARALETPGAEVPLLGMAKFQSRPLLPGRLALSDVLHEENGGVIVTHASSNAADALTDARRHGDFDDDKATMTSSLLRVLGLKDARGREYVPNAALLAKPGAPAHQPTAGGPPPARHSAARHLNPHHPSGHQTTSTQPTGGPPIAAAPTPGLLAGIRTGVRPATPPPPPVPAAPEVDQVAAPTTGRLIIDRMTRDGWAVVRDADAPEKASPKGRKKASGQGS